MICVCASCWLIKYILMPVFSVVLFRNYIYFKVYNKNINVLFWFDELGTGLDWLLWRQTKWSADFEENCFKPKIFWSMKNVLSASHGFKFQVFTRLGGPSFLCSFISNKLKSISCRESSPKKDCLFFKKYFCINFWLTTCKYIFCRFWRR